MTPATEPKTQKEADDISRSVRSFWRKEHSEMMSLIPMQSLSETETDSDKIGEAIEKLVISKVKILKEKNAVKK